MQGYHREARACPGAPPWTPPSPALRSRASTWCYPSTVFSEALPSLDCDRSGDRPFQVLAAPYIRSDELSEALNHAQLPGVSFEPDSARPRNGVRIRVTQPKLFLPVTTGITILCLLRDLYGDRQLWKGKGVRESFFDALCGTSQVREELQAGESSDWIAAGWAHSGRTFEEQRAKHLLYAPTRTAPKPARTHRSEPPPQKAVVLAAGYGTRMLPLSLDRPKPLMPLWGRPLIEHTLALLASWGVRDVLINLHHMPSEILAFVAKRVAKDLRISLSFESAILGTGGALDRARWFIDQQPFWMMNADIAADLAPTALLEDFARARRIASLWLEPRRGPLTVEVNRGVITSFRSRRPGGNGCHTFCGLQLLSPRILDYVPENEFSTIVYAYEKAMEDGHVAGGVAIPGSYWRDLGTREQYLAAHRETRAAYRAGTSGKHCFDPSCEGHMEALRKSGVHLRGYACVQDKASVAPGARIANSVIWSGAVVTRSAKLEQAIVGRQTRAEGTVRGSALCASQSVTAEEGQALERLGFSLASSSFIVIADRRGSARFFARIAQRQRRVMLVRYHADREENGLYAGHARRLRRLRIPVPRVLADHPRHGFTIMEDVGDLSVEQRMRGLPRQKRIDLYRRILDKVAVLHERGTVEAGRKQWPLMPPFSRNLYRWEADLFAEHFLRGELGLSPRAANRTCAELRSVANELLKQPLQLLHRDLQSSNILLVRGEPVFIDFQGMRMGPAVYDLASLLADPYVELDVEIQRELLDYYASRRGWATVPERLYWLAAVERLAQALGAFGRLSGLPGGKSFRRHIRPARRLLHMAAVQTGSCPLTAKRTHI